jgi:predicted DNA-binding transcriptional regulator YafY
MRGMRRADRLFLIIHALRGRRTALPARRLAETLSVSLRTVYRDVADLQLSGVPIEGEAGIGYMLRKGSDIPPLMFNADELEALVVGTRFVRAFAGERLSSNARAALLKIEAVLPEELRARTQRSRIFAPPRRGRIEATGMIDRLHAAISEQRVLRLDYCDEGGRASAREVEPLCLAFWGGAWTLGAWCRLRSDFRNFRPDRIAQFEITGEVFRETAERGLVAYLRAVGGDAATEDL